MYEFRFLLDRFWVTRAENKDLYFAVKRALPPYRRLVNEQLGWNLIVNEAVVKLEKVPAKAMAWMGIQEFQEKLDYCLLCALLLFLSDLDDGEQFLLSSLTEGIEALLAEVQPVDWTRFPHRKSLVRVLQYAQRTGMLLVYDGASEGFGSDQTQEVLYENTGLSRHFPTHFGRDTLHCASIEDYEAFLWEGEEADRGRQRIQRVYRQLALAPALYWSRQNRSDYEYVKNQRSWLNRHLGEAMGGELQIHRNGAFFVLDEESRFGLVHPREAAIPEAALLLCGQLREQVAAQLPDAAFNGAGDIPHVVNLSLPGCKSEVMLRVLESDEVYVSSGSACSKGKQSGVLKALGLPKTRTDSALRVSFCPSNTTQDVDAFIAAVQKGRKMLVR